MSEVQPDNVDDTQFLTVCGDQPPDRDESPFVEVPDDWHPDAATLDFIAQIVTQEIVRRGNLHGNLARGSDRHANEGAMLVLQALALSLVGVRKQVQSGTFGQTSEETNAEPQSTIITST